MLRRPDEQEITEQGKALGLQLTTKEIHTMMPRIEALIASLETFWELPINEQKLPPKYLVNRFGYRPDREEDPLNLFITKCDIQGASDGPLKGKTIGLKDHIAVAGIPLTFGSSFMEGYIPDFDATIVTRILDAGGCIVGKLMTDGFSTVGPGIGAPGDFGRPLNPHNHHHVTGGSSSGSAAAVAAGLVDISFGGDQGGSIRIPASWCGVLGLKPSHGLIPHTGIFGCEPIIDFVGPMARTVEDLAIALECVAGSDGFDPRQSEIPRQPGQYSKILGSQIKGIRIGLLEEGFGTDAAEPDVESAVMEALGILERDGAIIEKVSVPLHRKAGLAQLPILIEGWKRMLDTNLAGAFAKTYYPTSLIRTFGRFKQSAAHQLPMTTKMNFIIGAYLERYYHGVMYAKSYNVRPTFISQYNQAFTKIDLLAMPTSPIKAPIYKEPADYQEALDRAVFGPIHPIAANTSPFNFTGYPAISIPCGKSDGLPIGLQLVAPYYREDQLLAVAHRYQSLIDWKALMMPS